MKRWVLVVVAVLVLCSGASAFTDNFQTTDNENYYVDTWTNGAAYSSASLAYYPYTDTQTIRLNVGNGMGAGQYSWVRIVNILPTPSNYWSFNVKAAHLSHEPGGTVHPQFYVSFWDNDTAYMSESSDLYSYIQSENQHWEMLRSGSSIALYIDGVYKDTIATVTDAPSLIGLRLWGNCYKASANLYIDDIYTTTGLIGTLNHDQNITRNWDSPASNSPLYVTTSYTWRNVTGLSTRNDPADSIVTKYAATGSIINTTSLSDDSAGYIKYNVSDLLYNDDPTEDHYGIYWQQLLRGTTILSTDYFFYKYESAGKTEGGTVSFNKDTYVLGEEMRIAYTINSPDFVGYDYTINILEIGSSTIKNSYPITSASGTWNFTIPASYDAGTYFAILTIKSDKISYDDAYDVANINDEIKIEGITKNARTSDAIDAVNATFLEGAQWYNATSDSTGTYNVSGLVVDIAIDVDAKKINYTHENFQFRLLMGGCYQMDLYLFQSNITRSSTAVEGMVVSYPLHQSIPNATVNIWNDTWSSNTTATSWGYYIFDNLTCGTSSVLNETFNSSEYDTWLSLNYSNIKNGSELVSNITDETPFVRDTDYSINYTNGTIKALSTGSMVNYTDYHIDYDYYVETTYHVNATESGYTDSEDYDVIVTYNNWTVQNVLLHPIYTLTVKAKDYDSQAFISSFTATLGSDSVNTTNGTAIFYLNYGLYTINVAASGYYPGMDSLLLNQNKTSTITLTKIESVYYAPHYVKFKLVSVFGKTYPDVATVVYTGDNASGDKYASGTTGTDGAVVFKMTENIQYTLTFTNVTQGIDETLTVYPKDTEYFIYIDSFSWSPPENQTIRDTADWWWTHKLINVTYGWINFTYTDTANETASIIYWINDSNDTNIYSFNTTYPDSWTVSQVVPANNTTYIVHFSADHPRFDSLSGSMRSTISFSGKRVSFGWSEQWMYDTVAVCAIIFLGLLFSATSVNVGAVISALSGWMFMWMGWLSGTTVNYGMMVLATIIAVGFAMRKGEVMHT